MAEVPEGFRLIPRLSPFNELVGPLYERRAGDEVSIGVRIEVTHANSRGICHGGKRILRASAIFARAEK